MWVNTRGAYNGADEITPDTENEYLVLLNELQFRSPLIKGTEWKKGGDLLEITLLDDSVISVQMTFEDPMDGGGIEMVSVDAHQKED